MARASTRRLRLIRLIALAFAALVPFAPAIAGQDARRPDVAAAPPAGGYVFTYFTKNGEDGLHLAWSADGYRWGKVAGGRSLLAPQVGKAKLMRDPCVVRGPNGTYHMVWTSGWNENNIGHASSRDLITWSAQQAIPVMAHEPTVLNAWAPEVVYDGTRQEYLIFWASTIPGRFVQTAGSSEEKYNHRIYATTTKDWATFTPTTLFYDPGFSVIDATFLETAQGPRLIVKDETRYPPKKYLQLAGAADRHGPFPALAPPFTPAGVWVEGPTALRVGEDYVVYFDAYIAKHYGALRSRDLVTWEDVTAKMHFPDEGTAERMRHGTVIAVPADLLAGLRALR
jgi:arabinosidase-like protein